MRCYFHLVSATEHLLDTTGVEVASAHQAYSVALTVLQELRDEGDSDSWNGWFLDATDSTGHVMFSINLTTEAMALH
ncbi:DUF6894 family protein [Microvirga mediterraneensis]|uniref:DUF6894 domain-containing protein n=1 Tax=Microvirga mediterraneensis TaxID=2754695 RepID=A0A838BVL6_9HYPH|nr:hypothetical protein [Microvirga mediterraneensis]MBA1159398.1 hypothetical protein [Microvirga mediterraneensis]